MTYAPAHRPFDDADSHIMELPDFRRDDGDPAIRDHIAQVSYAASLVDQSSADLHPFSIDYPHMEGGRDPIGRFEGSLGDRHDGVRDQFYAENFLRIFPDARVH